MAHTRSVDTGAGSAHRGTLSPFARHFVQMGAVMFAGMVVSATVFLFTVGMTWDEATVERPVASLLVIAAGMTLPMAAWMLHRGMGVRNSVEMAAAMTVPVLPFLFLVWFDVTKSALCGGYCIVALVAMIGLMMYRRSEYSMEMHSDHRDEHGSITDAA